MSADIAWHATTTKLACTVFATLAVIVFFTVACGGEEVDSSSSPQPPAGSPGITISTSSIVVTEAGGSDSFTVSLDAEPVSDVVIALTPSDSGEASVSPEVLAFSAENWNTPQSVTATGVDDWLTDGDISSTMEIAVVSTSSDPFYADVEPQSILVTTVDDELLSGGPPDDSAEETVVDPAGETGPEAPPSGDSTASDDAADEEEAEDWEEQILPGELLSGLAPHSGLWEFTMNATAADLSGPECPSSGSVGSNGPAAVDTYGDGIIVTVDLDNFQLIFNRVGDEDTTYYETTVYNFPVQTPSGGVSNGLVHFSLSAVANDYIEGFIHWKNLQGCQGDYPFNMVLVDMELPDNIYILSDGIWNIEFMDLDGCDQEITGFTSLPTGDVQMQSSANLDALEHTSSYVDFSNTNGAISLLQDPDSNTYHQPGEPFDLGMPENVMGDVLLDYESVDFIGVIEAIAIGIDEMIGTLTVTGSNGCGFTTQVSMSFVGHS